MGADRSGHRGEQVGPEVGVVLHLEVAFNAIARDVQEFGPRPLLVRLEDRQDEDGRVLLFPQAPRQRQWVVVFVRQTVTGITCVPVNRLQTHARTHRTHAVPTRSRVVFESRLARL